MVTHLLVQYTYPFPFCKVTSPLPQFLCVLLITFFDLVCLLLSELHLLLVLRGRLSGTIQLHLNPLIDLTCISWRSLMLASSSARRVSMLFSCFSFISSVSSCDLRTYCSSSWRNFSLSLSVLLFRAAFLNSATRALCSALSFFGSCRFSSICCWRNSSTWNWSRRPWSSTSCHTQHYWFPHLNLWGFLV